MNKTKHTPTPTSEYWLSEHTNNYILYKGNYAICGISLAEKDCAAPYGCPFAFLDDPICAECVYKINE